jgi:hypothetical protein
MSETSGFRCDYKTGMFSNEPRLEHIFAIAHELERAAYHEAGHAVLGYALGDGLTGIGLYADVIEVDGERRMGVGGICRECRNIKNVSNSRIRRRRLDDRVIAYAISIAAGPAAERKFNILTQEPRRTIFGSEGDHDKLGRIRGGIVPYVAPLFDLTECAWRLAQDALETDLIWDAVSVLADERNCCYSPEYDDGPGEYRSEMPGVWARAILHQCGIRPGVLKVDQSWRREVRGHAKGACDGRRRTRGASMTRAAFAALAFMAIAVPAYAVAPELHFAREERLDTIDAALIGEAPYTIDLAAYVLRDSTVIDALIAAERRGVVVRIVLDSREPSDFVRIEDLSDNVRVKRSGPLLTSKEAHS